VLRETILKGRPRLVPRVSLSDILSTYLHVRIYLIMCARVRAAPHERTPFRRGARRRPSLLGTAGSMAEPSAGADSSGGGTPSKPTEYVHTAEELAAMSGPDSLAPLSYTLAHVVGVDEQELVSGLRQTDVVQRAVEMAKEQLIMPKEEVTKHGQDVLCKVFGGLVNLACIGGVELVKEQDGLDLMIDGMQADLYAVRYFAVAGLQNMCGQDYECAWRVVQTDSEPLLQELLKTTGKPTPNPNPKPDPDPNTRPDPHPIPHQGATSR
jgi:hypothetical protein